MKIRGKLLTSFLACSLVPVLTLGAINFWNARSAAVAVKDNAIRDLRDAAQSKLAAVRDVKKSQISDYFGNAAKQLKTMSTSPQTVSALSYFTAGFKTFAEERGATTQFTDDDISQLKTYYRNTFSPEYGKANSGKIPDVESKISQLNKAGIALQHAFITLNSNPIGSKQLLDETKFNTSYDAIHRANHPYFRSVIDQFAYYDIFLIDAESGDIVYTVFKEIDFATNLVNGPYSSSNLAVAFRKALTIGRNDPPVLVDFERYFPSMEAPASFIACPVFDGEKRTGVIAIQVPIAKINETMNIGNSIGTKGEAYLVGTEGLPRSDSRFDTQNFSIVNAFANPTAGTMKSETITTALSGKEGTGVSNNYLGTESIAAYTSVDILGLRWALIAEESSETALAAAEGVSAAATTAQTSLLYWLVGMTSISGAIIAAFAWWTVRNLMRPIDQTIATLRDIAEGEGDLTRRLDATRTDELGELAKWFNAFANRIHDVICIISSNAQQLSQSSVDLSATAEQLSSGASDSKAQSASVSAAAEQMSVNMREVADSTDGMSQTIRAVAASVEEMNQTIREIARNAEKSATVAGEAASLVQVSNDKISNLGEAADEIGKVIEVIQDIAEQTNLLALNATIEAARAGEAGKGFAVVANEVKELAKQTAAATDDIRSRIEAIQASTGDAVESIREISDVITNVNEVSRTIASAVEEQSITTRQISDNVSTTANAAESVARGVAETAMASREITQNITRVDGVLLQTAQGADESREAGQRLSELADEMNQLIGQFRIDRNVSGVSRKFEHV